MSKTTSLQPVNLVCDLNKIQKAVIRDTGWYGKKLNQATEDDVRLNGWEKLSPKSKNNRTERRYKLINKQLC